MEGYYKEDRIEQGNKQKKSEINYNKETLDKFVGKVYAISESYDPFPPIPMWQVVYKVYQRNDIGQSVIENQF